MLQAAPSRGWMLLRSVRKTAAVHDRRHDVGRASVGVGRNVRNDLAVLDRVEVRRHAIALGIDAEIAVAEACVERQSARWREVALNEVLLFGVLPAPVGRRRPLRHTVERRHGLAGHGLRLARRAAEHAGRTDEAVEVVERDIAHHQHVDVRTSYVRAGTERQMTGCPRVGHCDLRDRLVVTEPQSGWDFEHAERRAVDAGAQAVLGGDPHREQSGIDRVDRAIAPLASQHAYARFENLARRHRPHHLCQTGSPSPPRLGDASRDGSRVGLEVRIRERVSGRQGEAG